MAKFPKILEGADVDDIDLSTEEFIFHGERLTEERAEQIAVDRFERSRNLIPGGKSLSGGSKHSPALNVRLPESDLERLDELARRRNVRRSRLAREILHDYIEQHT